MSSNSYTLTPEQSLAMAEQLINAGQKQQALNLLLQSLHRLPGHPLLTMRLARLLHQHGQNNEAIRFLQTAYAKGHQPLELSYFLAALLHLEHQFTASTEILNACISSHPEFAPAFNLKGTNLIELNQYEAAIEAFGQAIAINPDSADAYNNLAWALRALGRKQEAITQFEKAFAVNNQATEALSGLLLLKTFSEKTAEFDAVERLISSGQLSIKQNTELRFALGKAYEDIKNYPTAFSHFHQANRQWRNTLDYHISTDERLFETIKNAWGHTLPSQLKTPENNIHLNMPTPIFVVGMPRSSTTLIEQILSSHPAIVGGGELPYLEQVLLNSDQSIKDPRLMSEKELEQLATNYLDQVRAFLSDQLKDKHRYFTDKLPQNFRFIGAILRLFPNAKIIHCKREPMDTCLSLFKHHFPMARHHYAYDLKELGQYYRLYETLMSYWHELAPGKIYDIQYETLLDNFESEVRTMLEFCDLPFEPGCLSFEQTQRVVRTASSDQVRQGLFKQGAGRWLHYQQQLAPLKASLQSYS